MFRDRLEAGRRLAEKLAGYRGMPDAVVLGIPRGGVVLAAEVAGALAAPLDVLVVRKVGHPLNPEFAAGAVDPDGGLLVNPFARVSEEEVRRIAERERAEIERRLAAYRAGRPPLELRGKTAILVDDGIATGLTALKAAGYARDQGAGRVVVAAAVMSREAREALAEVADEVVAVDVPEPFGAVGQFYREFPQVSDAEVVDILAGTPASRT
ncbi:MAG: phosphoribosyltransferase [Coriobacteriia bacterium]|nr:phosphoribosyltransferase [Coriobacteriia bacterium]